MGFLFFIFLLLIVFAGAAWFLFIRWRAKGFLARALGMSLFLVRVPREIPKEGDRSKQEKESIGVMEQLYSSFANFHASGWKKFIYGEPYLALELAVHHLGEEIHFYVAVPRSYEAIVEKQILGFYPTAEVSKTKDYNIFNPQGVSAGSYLVLERNPVLPFRTYQKMEADPLGEIITALSKLEREGEGASLQILIKPSHRNDLKTLASKVTKELQLGYDFYQALKRAKKSETVEALQETFSMLFSPDKKKTPEEEEKARERKEKQRVTTPYHEELVKSITAKVSKPLFETNVRIVTSALSEARASQILSEIESAFTQFSLPDLNSIKPTRAKGAVLKKLIFDYSFRIFDEARSMPLSTEEIGSLYHFPLLIQAVPRVKFLKSKSSEPPPDLPKTGLFLGKNVYRGEEHLIRIEREDRRRHLYIIGQTGTGKTTFLHSLICQDIEGGEGVSVVDPHGDLVEDVLKSIPRERVEDVIVFDPGDIERPLGLNILEIDPTRPEQKSFVVDDFYKILRMIYKDIPEAFGPIFEKFFKNTIMLLLDDYENEIPTIADISRVFADKEYRDVKLDRETNPEIVRFWRFEAERMSGEWSLPNMSGYITSKFAPFLINDYVRPIITQQKSAFNFREAMDSRKILLVNLSKGRIGELNANLLGMIIVSKILVSAFSRVDQPVEERSDFYLYIDEFQNFTTDSIATILSEARKYRLNLIIAHQFIKQLEERIKNAVFGNVGSMVAFRIGEEDAEFLKTRYEPVFTPQDLVNIDNFNAYVKLLIRNQTSRPFNMQVVPASKGNPEIAKAIKELSRLKYGRDRAEVEREFRERQERAIF
jgi:hypothetical protein